MIVCELQYGRMQLDEDTVVEGGDQFEVDDATYERWSNRLIKIKSTEDTPDVDEVVDFDEGAYDIARRIKNGEYDDYLDEILNREHDGKDRVTVTKAVQTRQEELD